MELTPKEKAKELVEKFLKIGQPYGVNRIPRAKQCALIAVDEMIDLCWSFYGKTGENTKLSYWQEVKNEIEKKQR